MDIYVAKLSKMRILTVNFFHKFRGSAYKIEAPIGTPGAIGILGHLKAGDITWIHRNTSGSTRIPGVIGILGWLLVSEPGVKI